MCVTRPKQNEMAFRRPTFFLRVGVLALVFACNFARPLYGAPPQFAVDLQPGFTAITPFPGFPPKFISSLATTEYIELNNPAGSRRYDLEYDYPRYSVTYTTTIGTKIKLIPASADLGSFVARRIELNLRNMSHEVSNRSLATDQKKKAGGLFTFQLPIKSRTFESIFGEGGAGLQVTGYRRISFSGRSSWDDRQQTAFHRQSKFPSLEMEQIYSFDISGTIGSKISVKVTQDSRNDLPLANRLILRYRGSEDDVLQSVEAGNTTLDLPGTQFLRYSSRVQGLFGIKATAQVADVSLTAIASQEKGSTQSVSISAGSSALSTRVIQDINYAERTIYDLGRKPLFRAVGDTLPVPEKYDFEVDATGRIIDSIIKAIVYIDDNTTDEAVRVTRLPGTCYIDYPDTTSDDPLSRFRVEGRFKEVDGKDFYISRKECYLQFVNPVVGSDDVIGVYMEVYRKTGSRIDTIGRIGDTLKLKLIKPKFNNEVNHHVWEYEWKNVYNLQATNIDLSNFEVDIYKGRTIGGQQHDPNNDDIQDGIKYLRVLGLDQGDDAGNNAPDGRIDRQRDIIDQALGLLVFPDRHPFSTLRFYDTTASGEPLILKDTVPEVYNSANQTVVNQASKYYMTVTAKGGGGTSIISLNANNIIEGSEVVLYRGARLSRGIDYEIDYDFGRLTLLKDEYSDLNSSLSVTFETAPLFSLAQKTLLGTRLEYAPNRDLKLGTTLLYKSDKSTSRKPKVGEETSNMMVWDADFSYRFESGIMTRAINAIPLISTAAKSYMQISAEVAQSRPNPNVDGEVFIDDFEGAKDSYSLGIARTNWQLASRPLQKDTALAARARIAWYNPRTLTPVDSIWNRETGQGESNSAVILTVAFQPKSLDSTGPEQTWNGFMRSIPPGVTQQLTNAQLLEIRMRPSGNITNGFMHVDLGRITEDINGDGRHNTEDLDGLRIHRSDLSTDRGYDTLFNVQEPGYDAANNPDPDGDDWNLNDIWKMNGTEGNALDPDGGSVPDAEDRDNDGFEQINDYFSYRISLNPADSNVYENSFIIPGTNKNDWRTIRIPLREPWAVDSIAGNPDWNNIASARIWFDGSSDLGGDNFVQIASIELVSSTWADSMFVADSLRSGAASFDVAVVNTEVNSNYHPPEGVSGYYDEARQATEAEQSLLLKFENLNARVLVNTPDSGLILAADTGLAVKKLFRPSNYLGYKKLEAYVNADLAADDSVLFFLRLGTDKNAYYEFRTVLNGSSLWHPDNHVLMDFAKLAEIKAELLKDRTEGRDSSYSRTDGHYVVKMGKSLQDPSLTRITYFSMGVVNLKPDRPASGEVWVDELRLTDVRNDVGMAARVSLNGSMADLGNFGFSYSYEDAYYRGIATGTKGGSDNNLGSGATRQNYSFNTSFSVDKFLPRSLELRLPVSLTWNQSVDEPLLRRGTDIIVPEEFRNDETTLNISRGLTVNESINRKTRNPLFTVLLNKLKTGFSYNTSRNRSPQTPYSFSESYRANADYSLGMDKPWHIKPLFWSRPLKVIPLGLPDTKLYLIPTRFSAAGSMNGSYSKSLNYIQGNYSWNPPTVTRNFQGRWDLTFKVFDNLNGSFGASTTRDLKDSKTVKFSLNPKTFKLGIEQSYNQNFRIGYAPRLFPFLTHSLDYSASYTDTYRSNTRDSIFYHSASVQSTMGVSGTFNHQTLIGSNKGGTRQGIRSTRGKNVQAEKKTSLLSTGLRGIRYITDAVNPVTLRWSTTENLGYPALAGKAKMPFRLGLTNDPGVEFVSTSGGVVRQSRSVGKQAGAQSGVNFFSGISANVSYGWSTQESFETSAPSKGVSTTWPDIKFNFRAIKGLWYVGKVISYLSPSSGLSVVNERHRRLTSRYPSDRKRRIALSPLISFTLTPVRALRTNFRVTRTTSETSNINENTGALTQMVRSVAQDLSVDASYSFSSPGGIGIPLLGRLKFQSSLSMSVTVTYNKSKDEKKDAGTKFKFTPSAEKSSLTVRPTASYSFSNNVKGGLQAQWQDSKDLRSRRTTHVRELGLWVEMRF